MCVQAGKSAMETRWFIDVAWDGPQVSRAVDFKFHKRFENGQTDILDD